MTAADERERAGREETGDAEAGHAEARHAEARRQEATRAPSTLSDRVIAGVVMATAVALLIYALGFPSPGQPEDPGTAALPLLIAAFLLVLGVLLLFRAEHRVIAPEPGARLRTLLMVVAGIAYTSLLVPLGFVLATGVFMVVGLLIMGVRSPVRLVLVPIVVTLAVYYLFTAGLGVYLPAGAIEGVLP